MERRAFISQLSVFTGAIALAGGSFSNRASVLNERGELSSWKAAGYGELNPTASKNTGETFLSLPKGFEYNVFGKKGSMMSDGRVTPPLHDGMWAFQVGGELRLVRNHEVTGGRIPNPGSAIGKANHYDADCGGGTTTLVIDRKTRMLTRDFVSLSGTMYNCAGGPTPWGSWISCEETTLGQSIRTRPDGTKSGGFARSHGYCFEVSASANSEVESVPLKAMGRFVHEAAAVDRKSGIVYLTEDVVNSGFYRFVPKRKGRLAEGGTLQMLAIRDKKEFDTRKGQKQGTRFDVVWVTIEDPDPAAADLDPSAVFKEGRSKGGAIFARLEGCCAEADRSICFVSTNGGDASAGQIWRYRAKDKYSGELTLLFESTDREVLDMPDNICAMPKTRLLFICENSDFINKAGVFDNYIRVLTPSGRMADFAKNIVPEFANAEFAGTTFSPDGSTLFFNLQQLGATFAVWGDWSKFRS